MGIHRDLRSVTFSVGPRTRKVRRRVAGVADLLHRDVERPAGMEWNGGSRPGTDSGGANERM